MLTYQYSNNRFFESHRNQKHQLEFSTNSWTLLPSHSNIETFYYLYVIMVLDLTQPTICIAFSW